MSRTIQFRQFGSADVLEAIECPPISPSAGEVLIAAEAIGINWYDTLWRRNMGSTKATLPAGLGSEMAGRVVEVGADVTRFSPGDRVASIPAFDPNRYSTYAETVLLPADSLIHYPDCLTPGEASVHYLPSLMSWFAFCEIADLQPNDTILITYACQLSGPYAVQIARALGARVIAATPFEEATDYLKSLGASAVIHTETQDVVKRVHALTDGYGVNVVLDALGGPQMSLLGDVLATRGDLILCGMLGGNETSFPAQAAFRKNIQFHVHCLSNFTGKPALGIPQNPQALERAVANVNRLTVSGELKPQIDSHFSFDDIVEAHHYLEACNFHGRVVVDVSQ